VDEDLIIKTGNHPNAYFANSIEYKKSIGKISEEKTEK